MSLLSYKAIFENAFQYDEGVEQLEYQSIPAWDSVGHMQLIAALEEAFNIEMDVDDIIDFSSYSKGIELLTKYGVDLSD